MTCADQHVRAGPDVVNASGGTIVVNVLLALAGLVFGSVAAAAADARLLLAALLTRQLLARSAGLLIAPAALLLMTAVVMVLAGMAIVRLRPTMSLVQGCIASLLFLGLQVGGTSGTAPVTPVVVVNVLLLWAAATLAFWLPATFRARHQMEQGQWGLAVHFSGLFLVSALCLLIPRIGGLSTAGTIVLAPLARDARIPEFGDQRRVTRALADGASVVKDTAREANRQAVLAAADRVRADPCDSAAYFGLRRALLTFLHANLEPWHHDIPETVAADGRTIDVSAQLDAPSLQVFRLALAAQILQPNDLPAAAPRYIIAAHATNVGKSNPQVAALICNK